LRDKIKELQNKLLDDEIGSEEYEKKKKQIQLFIDEAQEDLKNIDNGIKSK